MLENDTALTLKASYDRKREIKMFLDNLSTSVLRLCDARKLSYEAASELCDLSSRYFGDIARGKTAPTILTLEKLCVGFDLTPNDLLIPSAIWREMSFRKPMAGDADPLFPLPTRSYRFPCLPSMWKDYGTGIPALLRPLWAMSGLECLLQSNHYPASQVTRSGAYPLIRPASFTRWLLLACPFFV